MGQQNFDPKAFRQALGSFATGVTIITTRSGDGEPVGLTVSSFNSVSLEPPLVLWSLAKSSLSLDIFENAEHWAVHVLSTEQADLSSRFAMQGEDKFAGLELEDGVGNTPLLQSCSARFQCKKAFQYEGGDHLIFVGEVVEFDRSETAPLVFHGGQYAHATARNANNKPKTPYLAGSFSDNFLGYLLGRSHFRFYGQIRPLLESENLNDEEFFVLSTLTLKSKMSDVQMAQVLGGVLDDSSESALGSLTTRGLIKHSDQPPEPGYSLTSEGSTLALKLISAAKGVEAQAIEKLGDEETAVLKSLLHRLLESIDPDAASLWDD